jgi:hypothetical protein
MFSILFGLAHATIGLAASQAALTVLSVPAHFLGEEPAAATPKHNECWAIVPWAAAPDILNAPAIIIQADNVEEVEGETVKELDVIEINTAVTAAVADADQEEALGTLSYDEGGDWNAYDPVTVGEDAVFAAVIGAGASQRQATGAVAFYLRRVIEGSSAQDAVALATAQAMRAIAADNSRVEGICAAYEKGASAVAALATGAQAAVRMGTVAVAVVVAGTCAVVGLAVLGAQALATARANSRAAPSNQLAVPFLPSITLPAISRDDLVLAASIAGNILVAVVNVTNETVDDMRNGPRLVTEEEAAAARAWGGVSVHADGRRPFVCC